MSAYIEIFRHVGDKLIKYNNVMTCRDDFSACRSERSKKTIHWSKTIGYIFDFSYNGFDGHLTIVDYDAKKQFLYFTINEDDDIYHIGIESFKKIGFSKVIRIRYHEFNIGDIVNNKKILGISYNPKHTVIMYKYECLNCGHIGEITQYNLKKSYECEVCRNCKVLIGHNDIPTTDPWMIDYFIGGYEEAKMYTAGSGEKIKMKCPHCGTQKMTIISSVYRNKVFSCACSDKMPYPEKCMINMLDMLNIDYLCQCSSSSLGINDCNSIYDFYIESENMIIETNGEQHYNETSEYSKWTDLDTIKQRDCIKKNVAIEHGIKNYVELDCRESNISWFKNSVMNSELPVILHFYESDIDWDKIDQLSMRNIVKEVCEYKEDHPYLPHAEIARLFGVNTSTLTEYYKKGEKYGWCTYDHNEIKWVSHFHRNTHLLINGEYFYNSEDVTNRSEEVFGEKIYGGAIRTYIAKSSGERLFKDKYNVRTVSHYEYLTNNTTYPPYISKEIIDGLRSVYTS